MEAQRRGGGKGIAQISLTSAVDESGCLTHALATLTPRERPDTHCIGGWVCSRAGEACAQNLIPNGIRPSGQSCP